MNKLINEKKEYVISDAMFEEIRDKAIEVWMLDDPERLDGRLAFIFQTAENTYLSFIYLINSLDFRQRRILISRLSKTTRNAALFGFEYLVKQHVLSQQQIDDIFFKEEK